VADAAPARAPLAWRVAVLRESLAEHANARTLVLDVPGWPGHLAGQHVDVRLTAEDGYTAERSYSIASAPGAPLALTVERLDDGEVSPYLTAELQVGEPLELRGPIGGWFTWRPEDGGPLLLVGGGSGVVPLMSMLRAHRDAGSEAEASLLLSARSEPDILFREELDALPRAHVHYTLTRERPERWHGFQRRITAEMLEQVAPPPSARPRIYVCGPTPFVETAANLLVALGHAPGAIHAERFGPSGG
jgi:ferredoxin-NADP reductase